jgi:hypothetical protein
MSTSRIAPPRAPAGVEDVLEFAAWRQTHEVRALRDTLAIYRRCVAGLAAENTRLQEQLADTSARAVRTDGKTTSTSGRTRGGCRP